MSRPTLEIKWGWGNTHWNCEISYITLDPVILTSKHPREGNKQYQKWVRKGPSWLNDDGGRANEPFAEQLALALQYFIQLEQDIEDVLLTK